MADYYTPTTEEVRMAYGDVHCFDLDAPHDHACPADQDFDRWLAAHDAEVRAAALAEQGEPEIEYRIDDGRTLSYSRSKSRADRALMKGHRVLQRTPERRASAWMPVPDTTGAES